MKDKRLVVVGINDSHDASAAVIIGGELVCAMGEERFQRVKSMGGFPMNAIEGCLALAGITKKDVDYVAVASNKVSPDNMHNIVPTLTIRDLYKIEEEYWQPVIYGGKEPKLKELFPDYKPKGKLYYPLERVPFAFYRELGSEILGDIRAMRHQFVADYFGLPLEKVRFIDHHTAHAYYGYHSNPNKKKNMLVITADAGGDDTYESVSVFRNGKMEVLHKGHTSLIAPIYSYMTLLLGMKPNEHEYKVMGLAPYAKGHEKAGPYKVFRNALRVEGLSFVRNPEMKDMFKYFQDRLKFYRFDGIAGGLQDFVEDIVTEWVGNAVAASRVGDVVLSGGLFLNIKANKAIAEMRSVKSLFVPPGIGDESLSIGSAYVLLDSLETKAKISPLKNAYLGSSATKNDVEALIIHPIIKKHYRVKRGATPDDVAKVLMKGEICALFQGAMEFGPRALGHRSIIADPSKPESVKKINEAIKMRDFWMPFTPSVLSEKLDKYVKNTKEVSDKYMTVSFDTTDLGKKHLAAAIHPYDQTARPQRVEKTVAPEYHAIIKAFEKRSGIGAVLNTSLNIHGKPIVRNPVEIADEILSNADVRLDNIYVDGVLFSKRSDF